MRHQKISMKLIESHSMRINAETVLLVNLSSKSWGSKMAISALTTCEAGNAEVPVTAASMIALRADDVSWIDFDRDASSKRELSYKESGNAHFE
jgi:hypothetical protein